MKKTAYEMRISVWSSDVCSSDLVAPGAAPPAARRPDARARRRAGRDPAAAGPRRARDARCSRGARQQPAGPSGAFTDALARSAPARLAGDARSVHGDVLARRGRGRRRSEEHTSELQSLMRHSYAVFCLKKKTRTKLAYTTAP